MTSTQALCGHRILVAEDDALLAITLEDMLKSVGATVVGPAVALEEAEKFAEEETLSAALLDIRFDCNEVWPVARILAARGVPFVFSTGHYDRESLPTEWSDRPILRKPVGRQKIVTALTEVILRH